MAQNVILQVCDLERLRSPIKVQDFLSDPHHLPISTWMKFLENLISSFSFTGIPIVDSKVARRKKKMYICIHVLTKATDQFPGQRSWNRTGNHGNIITFIKHFWFNLGRRTVHSKFNLTGVRTKDLWIMTEHFMSPRRSS